MASLGLETPRFNLRLPTSRMTFADLHLSWFPRVSRSQPSNFDFESDAHKRPCWHRSSLRIHHNLAQSRSTTQPFKNIEDNNEICLPRYRLSCLSRRGIRRQEERRRILLLFHSIIRSYQSTRSTTLLPPRFYLGTFLN